MANCWWNLGPAAKILALVLDCTHIQPQYSLTIMLGSDGAELLKRYMIRNLLLQLV
ncbi:MAG: hypothetical protein R3B84_16660 [Zavarzinella sp.]